MNDRGDWIDPIIIVGPGRSGTSLLGQMLNAHPDVTFIGEAHFFLQKVRTAVTELGLNYSNIREKVKKSRADWAAMSLDAFRRDVLEFKGVRNAPAARDAYAAVMGAEQVRKAALAGRFFHELVCPPDTHSRRWCFKDLWAGSNSFQYSWDLYHQAFPAALFVQSVRHPLAYASSYLGREDPAEDSDVRSLFVLSQWVQMMRHNMALAESGRYFKFRLEDLVGAPEQTFQQICEFLELRSHPPCLEVMKQRYGGDVGRHVTVSPHLLDEVEGLRPLMEELGY